MDFKMNVDDFYKIGDSYHTNYSKNIGAHCLSIVVGSDTKQAFSCPTNINLDINDYKYIRIFMSKSKDISNVLFDTYAYSLELISMFGINKLNDRTMLVVLGYMCFDLVSIPNLEIIYNNMLGLVSAPEVEKTQPCSVCKFNDKWNCKQNNKWFCYKHCSY
jgi:hypothetical protein